MNENGLKAGTVLHDRYRIEKEIGRGGFSIVYRALDLLVFRDVAIKEFFPENLAQRDVNGKDLCVPEENPDDMRIVERSRKSFQHEIAVLEEIRDIPYVTRLQEAFSENNTEYIVLNLVRGKSLMEYQRANGGRISAGELLPCIEKALFALEQIHDRGLIHRDISPKNLIITPEADLYIIDFGSASAIDSESPLYNGEIFSHKGFHAPEYDSPRVQGTWTDIYCMCATIVYLLSGESIGSPKQRAAYDILPQLLMHCGLSASQQNALRGGLQMAISIREKSARVLRTELCRELYYSPGSWTVKYAAKTDVGSRKVNQDNLIVDGLFYFEGNDFEKAGEINCKNDEFHVAAVCDGVGGAVAGELASRAAVQAVNRFIKGYRFSDMLPERMLEDLMDQINEKILALGRKIGKTATAISILVWKGHHYYAINIGDCTIYQLHKKRVRALSEQHTVAREKLERGETILPEDLHTLTRYLGKENVAGSSMMTFRHGHIEEGDSFMLCSDGIAKKIRPEKMRKHMAYIPERAVESIWKVLDRQKDTDNCSAVVLRFQS